MKNFRLLCREKASKPLTPLNAIAQGMIDQGFTLRQAMEHFQRVYVLRAGIACDGNATRMGTFLGVNRNSITRILRTLGLPSVQPRRRSKESAV